MTCYVYFIQGVDGGLIKIGSSIDVDLRLKTLQAGSPVKLRVIGAVEGNARGERWLHKRLSSHRAHGEWFEPHSEVMEAIAQALAGTLSLVIEPEASKVTLNTIRIDREILRAVGIRKVASALGFGIKEISEWTLMGIPKPHRATVNQLYYKDAI